MPTLRQWEQALEQTAREYEEGTHSADGLSCKFCRLVATREGGPECEKCLYTWATKGLTDYGLRIGDSECHRYCSHEICHGYNLPRARWLRRVMLPRIREYWKEGIDE